VCCVICSRRGIWLGVGSVRFISVGNVSSSMTLVNMFMMRRVGCLTSRSLIDWA